MSERDPVELLIYEPAYHRLKHEIHAQARPVRALVMDDSGAVRANGRRGGIEPEIAWANPDLYVQGPVRDFMVACLKASRLRWLQTSAAGFDHPVFAKIVAKGVTLTNANASAVPIAEFVMAQVLDAFHDNRGRARAQARRDWSRHPFRDVSGTTWLVFGLGNIGVEVARRAGAFGARVIGSRRTPRGGEPVDELVPPGQVVQALPRSDVVVLTAALNDSTRHAVDAAFLAAMKPGCILVNVGRGGLVDEPALLAGLDAGRPELAILDVFEEEPLAQDSPFWEHPRVRVSAHCAAASEGTSIRGDQVFLANLRRYLHGEPLAMQVVEPAG